MSNGHSSTSQVVAAFYVWAKPQPRGSKVAIPVYNPHRRQYVHDEKGRPLITMRDDNEKSTHWMQAVSTYARQAWKGRAPLAVPLTLSIVFRFNRPRSHYGKGRNAKVVKEKCRALAPIGRRTYGDLAKLIRGTEDAISGIIWEDDSQIVTYGSMHKEFTEDPPHAFVVVETCNPMEWQK